MPTYTSALIAAILVKGPNGYANLLPGVNEFNFYLKELPTGVSFTSHEPFVNPFLKIDDYTSFPSVDIDVYAYESIVISNKTDDVCGFYANDDDENVLELAAGGTLTINNHQEWGLLTIASAGTGTVTIWGVVNNA